MGIKYVLSGANERARLKGMFFKYLLGIALITMCSTIAGGVAELAGRSGDNTAGGVIVKGKEFVNEIEWTEFDFQIMEILHLTPIEENIQLPNGTIETIDSKIIFNKLKNNFGIIGGDYLSDYNLKYLEEGIKDENYVQYTLYVKKGNKVKGKFIIFIGKEPGANSLGANIIMVNGERDVVGSVRYFYGVDVEKYGTEEPQELVALYNSNGEMLSCFKDGNEEDIQNEMRKKFYGFTLGDNVFSKP